MNVTDKDVDQAIGYFVDSGYIEELYGDQEHYVKVLLVRAAESINQRVQF